MAKVFWDLLNGMDLFSVRGHGQTRLEFWVWETRTILPRRYYLGTCPSV